MPPEATEIGGVRLSSPDKVLYAEQGITKRALAGYYMAVAEAMLPHVAHRPITLVRCPAGAEKNCFYQRHAGAGLPAELSEVEVSGFEDSGAYLYITGRRGLIALVQLGVLEIHPWGARTDRPERPDRLILDLDPGEGMTFADVVAAALEVRAALQGIGLESFAKTTGGKGLHVVVPIERRHGWREAKGFAKAVADLMSEQAPGRYLARSSIAERKGRIFIDYLRNDPTSTTVAPYSTRARPGAPVATPLHWEEVTEKLDPSRFTLESVPQRLKEIGGDPWGDIGKARQRLPKLSG